MRAQQIDIKENDILKMSPEQLNTLPKDHTLSTEDKQINIFWGTDNYASHGKGFQYNVPITIESITGENGNIRRHNGTYALIKDWCAPKAKQKIRFIDLMK